MDRLDLMLLVRNNPWFFSWRWKRLEHPDLHRRVVRPGDDVVIEGYPRSANTFATYAFEQAQGRKLKMGNHFHSPAQFHLAARYGVPAMLVIRQPRDAALSYMVFSPGMSASDALRRYIGFHKPLIGIADRFIVAPFEEITSDFDCSIDRLNRKFSTAFNPFDHTKARAQDLLTRIDAERDSRAGGHPELLGNTLAKSVPSEEKKAARRAREQEIDHPALARLRDEAEDLYRGLSGA